MKNIKLLLSICFFVLITSCEQGDQKGTTDTNNTKGAKDVTDSTRYSDSVKNHLDVDSMRRDTLK